LLAVLGSQAGAQRQDSARVAPRRPPADTAVATPKPPLSPPRAFLYSLLIPGYSQSRLGRPTAGAIFVFSESIAIAMLRQAAAELQQARRFRTDSLVLLGNDPVTGLPVLQQSGYSDALISVRKSHVEDWVAFLIANHLFAGADAYVAAHLWDLPTQISVRPGLNGTVIGARLRF
jgi:hypothetical protein